MMVDPKFGVVRSADSASTSSLAGNGLGASRRGSSHTGELMGESPFSSGSSVSLPLPPRRREGRKS